MMKCEVYLEDLKQQSHTPVVIKLSQPPLRMYTSFWKHGKPAVAYLKSAWPYRVEQRFEETSLGKGTFLIFQLELPSLES